MFLKIKVCRLDKASKHGSFYVANFSYHLEVCEIKIDANWILFIKIEQNGMLAAIFWKFSNFINIVTDYSNAIIELIEIASFHKE